VSDISRRIFLGNLNYQAEESDLREAFQVLNIQIGDVCIPADGDGRRKGFAFVSIADSEPLALSEIISVVDGVEICGRPCRAAWAKPKQDRNDGRRGDRRPHHDSRDKVRGRATRQRYQNEAPWDSSD
jgi:RNA recognition motif-containing protein